MAPPRHRQICERSLTVPPGNPWDNALAESFFKTLKRELVNGKGYKTREEAKQDAFKYIELCCNRRRMHSSIGYNAPCDLERDVARISLFFRPRNLDQSNRLTRNGPEFPPQFHVLIFKLPSTLFERASNGLLQPAPPPVITPSRYPASSA